MIVACSRITAKKFRETIDANPAYKDKVKRAMERYLGYLSEFYKL